MTKKKFRTTGCLVFTVATPRLRQRAGRADVAGVVWPDDRRDRALVPASTMAQRLVRAKRVDRRRLVLRPAATSVARLDAVLTVVYLVSEGHTATHGESLMRASCARRPSASRACSRR
jgi:predicted RNA polymerase sigma factor